MSGAAPCSARTVLCAVRYASMSLWEVDPLLLLLLLVEEEDDAEDVGVEVVFFCVLEVDVVSGAALVVCGVLVVCVLEVEGACEVVGLVEVLATKVIDAECVFANAVTLIEEEE